MKSILFAFLLGTFFVIVSSKTCYFLHGSGQKINAPPSETDPTYWSDNVLNFTPQCAKRQFLHIDGVGRRFDDQSQLKQVCGWMGGPVVKNAIIFSHSMGNIVIAEAIRQGLCSLDLATTDWYAAAPPTYGSKAANWAGKICSEPGLFDQILREFAYRMNYCKSTKPEEANPAYESLKTTEPKLQKTPKPSLAEIMGANLKGAACGNVPFGLVSKDSLALELLSKIVDFGESNDGMVSQSICQEAGTLAIARLKKEGKNFEWKGTADSPFYLANVNHADLTCRNKNGDWGAARQPCSWFKFRVAESTNTYITPIERAELIRGNGNGAHSNYKNQAN